MYMLTTVDNPWNPFTHFDEWYAFDQSAGYKTTSLLARIASTSEELSDADQDLAVEQAIDEIVRENVTGMYRKISSDGGQPVVVDSS
jgi:hypothetical protein